MPTRKSSLCKVLLLLVVLLVALTTIHADSDDEYVRQVLEEDKGHYNDDYHTTEEEYQRRQQQQREEYQKRQKQAQEAQERAAQEAADRVANERERKFQAELDQMKDEEAKKAALQQKRKDGRRVRSILKAAKNNNLYGVMGISNIKIQTPEIPINFFNVAKFTIPSLKIWKGPTEQQIKKQFRKRAMQVHPDKNKDGRAQEAFVAVQEAAQVLGDKQARAQYDAYRKENRSQQMELVTKTLSSALAVLKRMIGVCQTVLGPFFLPVMIIAVLII